MRKDELIASVQKSIVRQSLTQDSLKSVHPQVVASEIAKAYRTMMIQFYTNDANLMNAELDFYAKKYTESVKVDSDGFYYVDLPAKPIDLKNGLGVRYVKPKGSMIEFVRIRESELSNLRNLPAYCCMTNAYYFLDGDKITFDIPIPEHRLVEEVYVKLLPEFGDFEDTDNIQFPGGDMPAMQMILQIMGVRLTDGVNDDMK